MLRFHDLQLFPVIFTLKIKITGVYVSHGVYGTTRNVRARDVSVEKGMINSNTKKKVAADSIHDTPSILTSNYKLRKLNCFHYSDRITVIFRDEKLPRREDPVSHDAAMHITSAASS